MQFNLVSNAGVRVITVFHDGEALTANSTHPNFDAIVEGALAGDESIMELFDTGKTVARKFEHVSERVSVANGHVYFDGDEQHGAIVDQIVRFIAEDSVDYLPLVNFMEKVASNPNEHSRTQLFDWLARYDFAITRDGDFIAYKGVNRDAEGNFVSVSTGTAQVNGEEVSGQIPNNVGDIVTMPRSAVQHDPKVGCHAGLHAGTWEYASTFGSGGTLKVKINPRDVVSVPTDCDWQKIRTCRYEVLEIAEAPIPTAYYAYGEDDECWCGECYDGDVYCDAEYYV